MIAGLLLAAGGARRFGSQKLVALVDGLPLVRHAAVTLAGVVETLVVVTGNEAEAVRGALNEIDAQFVENGHWTSGLSSSIRAGVAALPPTVDAVVVLLGDEPAVAAGTITAVIERWRATGAAIVAARFRGRQGHPVLFGRAVFAELAALDGDTGAKPVIRRLPERVIYADFDREPPRDVDTPEDLARLSD